MVDETADLPLMAAVGFAAAVADAHPLVLAAAHWVSTAAGGRGAVRELCDALLRARARRARTTRPRPNRRQRQRPKSLMFFRIFTVIAVIALAVSTWILSSPNRRPAVSPEAQQAELPGYYLNSAVLTDYDETGSPAIRIHAERIDQIDHGAEVALHNVRFDYQAPNGQSWVMFGDIAHVEAGGKVIRRNGQRSPGGPDQREIRHRRGAHRRAELRRPRQRRPAPRAMYASISAPTR